MRDHNKHTEVVLISQLQLGRWVCIRVLGIRFSILAWNWQTHDSNVAVSSVRNHVLLVITLMRSRKIKTQKSLLYLICERWCVSFQEEKSNFKHPSLAGLHLMSWRKERKFTWLKEVIKWYFLASKEVKR